MTRAVTQQLRQRAQKTPHPELVLGTSAMQQSHIPSVIHIPQRGSPYRIVKTQELLYFLIGLTELLNLDYIGLLIISLA